MRFNNSKYILPVAAIALTTALGSCVKDLDVTPIDPSTTMTVDEPGLYTKCYANMALAGNTGANGDCDIDGLDGGTTGFVRQMWNANELTTDEAICGWGDPGIPQFNYNTWDASHPMLQGFYYRLYTGIAYCNHYLDVCADVDATRQAEIRFLRALYYYYLMDCYGNVPFTTALSAETPSQIQRADLFKWIEGELKEIQSSMLEPAARTSSDNGYGRADQDAVNLLLARMYLNAEVYTGKEHWEDAKAYAEKVIKGPHKLWSSGKNGWSAYQMLFMGDNGESGASCESILSLMQDGVTTTSWGTTLFLMASCWKDDMDLAGNYGTKEYWAGNRARSQFIAKFFPNGDAPAVGIADMAVAAGDDRALFHGIDRELTVTNPSEFTSGYSVGKFRNTYSTGATPHNSQFIDTDFFLMRAAEAYLIAAEAEARSNGGRVTETGLGYINDLRRRAHAKDATLDNCTLEFILDERSRELYYEGFRRTDLIRYGYFGGDNNYTWDWKGGVQSGQSFAAFRNVFALPAEDINANPKLTQNAGY
ncbi:MAG: RagB/SusD family nutrient uptake outer membrane protein [Bacteroidaceae bacterium]|nr:RagB/SusD family nutrient uptake outer membrane protein [Bacteroidaceae bacterium]